MGDRRSGVRYLIRLDGIAGITAGSVVLLLHDWLSDLYQLSDWLIVANGIANLLYGSYSSTLASLRRRPMVLIVLLAIANLAWAVLCIIVAAVVYGRASTFGIAHALLEAVFVGGLGTLEWRFRKVLYTEPLDTDS